MKHETNNSSRQTIIENDEKIVFMFPDEASTSSNFNRAIVHFLRSSDPLSLLPHSRDDGEPSDEN